MLINNHNFATPQVAFITSYPPRRCGIATFSCDLLHALKHKYNNTDSSKNLFPVVAINDKQVTYEYPEDVIYVMREDNMGDFDRCGSFLKELPVDAVSLQHEFNLYGGKAGIYILSFMSTVCQPVVTTLHTVLLNPSYDQKRTLQEVCNYSASVIVISQKAADLLKDIYDIPGGKIKVIHHGVIDLPFTDPAPYKKRLGLEGKSVILTFGLLDHYKGIEHVIDAMSEVTAEIPEATFVVLGTTHPSILKNHGESYLESLKNTAAEKGLSGNVIFNNRFVSFDLLTEYMLAADIFITPYLNKERISSGALAFALGCGKAIVSTPYYYAEEMLQKERGLLVPFRDSSAIASEILLLLQDDKLRNKYRENAYRFSRRMIWEEVAGSYLECFREAGLRSKRQEAKIKKTHLQ